MCFFGEVAYYLLISTTANIGQCTHASLAIGMQKIHHLKYFNIIRGGKVDIFIKGNGE